MKLDIDRERNKKKYERIFQEESSTWSLLAALERDSEMYPQSQEHFNGIAEVCPSDYVFI